MSFEWQEIKLADAIEIIGGGTPKTSVAEYWGGSIPWLSVGDFNNVPRYVEFAEKGITEKGLENSSTKLLNAGDLIISARGTVGALAQLKRPMAFNQSCYGIRGIANTSNTDFIFYVLKVEIEQLKRLAHGGVFDTITRETFKNISIFLPSLGEQALIANFLGALDDRITLLRDTNKTLEAIAQALFKSWFVDFDPVRARSECKLPEGMDEATAALFPDSLEETELGMVPKGWQVVSVGEVAEIVKGKSYSSKDLVEKHSTALVTLKSFERGGGFRMDGFKPYQGAYKPNQVVNAGDLIVAYTDVTQAAELMGKPALVVAVKEHDTLVASLDVGIVRPSSSNCGKQFLFGLFKTENFQQHTFAHTSGTTVLHLSKDGVGSYRFALPPKELCNQFEQVALALADRRQTNIDKIRTLGLLRDTLLPRLISGQLRIADAEAELEKVTA